MLEDSDAAYSEDEGVSGFVSVNLVILAFSLNLFHNTFYNRVAFCIVFSKIQSTQSIDKP